jgi:nitrate reductase NapAB chaperone NapD
MKKEQVKEILEKMPNEFDIEDLVERLLFIQKVEIGMKDSLEGKTITLIEAKERFFNKWEKQK